jgi:hypothetical protein
MSKLFKPIDIKISNKALDTTLKYLLVLVFAAIMFITGWTAAQYSFTNDINKFYKYISAIENSNNALNLKLYRCNKKLKDL